jgi:hypothetical protein
LRHMCPVLLTAKCVLFCFTHDNIELRRSAVTDIQIQALAEVFGITIPDLFPPQQPGTQTMWRVDQLTDRCRRRS